MKKSLRKGILGLACAAMLFSGGIAEAELTKDNCVFSREFDATDSDWNLMKFNSSTGTAGVTDFSKYVDTENGWIKFRRNDVGYGTLGVYYGDADDGYITDSSSSRIMFSTRFKVEKLDSGKRILFFKGKRLDSKGVNGANQEMLTLIYKDGKLALNNVNTVKDYALTNNTWYTVDIRIDYAAQKWYVDITDDAGNAGSFSEGFINGSAFKFYNITCFGFMATDVSDNNHYYYVDYMRLWDESFKLGSTSIENKAENVSADASFKMTFSEAPSESTLENITVTDSDKNTVPYEITVSGKNAELFFNAGLKYGEKYTVTLPNTISNAAGDKMAEKVIAFTTEEKPFVVGAVTAGYSGGVASSSVNVKNNGAVPKNIAILTAVYDDGVLVKMVSEDFTVNPGDDKPFGSKINVGELANPTVKAYLWDGINIK